MNILYHVDLDQVERETLQVMLSSGRCAACKLKRAQILLAAGEGVSDEVMASALQISGSTIYRTKRRFVEGSSGR